MPWYDATLGDPNTKVGLRKHLQHRLNGMRAQRGGQEALWMEVARFCQPTINRFLAGYANMRVTGDGNANYAAADVVNSKLMDARAVWASEVLGNGMHSGLTNPARPWFKLTIGDNELREYQAVKEWLDEVERALYELFAKTNFYTSAKSGYRELGVFGNEAGLMEYHPYYGLVVHPLRTGEYWFGLDAGLVPDSLYRRVDMTVLQHYEKFEMREKLAKGGEQIDYLPRQVVEAYSKGNLDQTFPVYHAVEQNDLRDPRRLDAKGKAYRSVYWSGVGDPNDKENERKALLLEQGFHSKPFWTARWDTQGSDVYASMYPGLTALADVRQLQLQVLRKQQGIDYMMKPTLAGPASLNNVHAALTPGRVIAMANVDKSNFGPIWEIDPQAINVVSQDTDLTRQAVDRGFYADLFNAITNMQGIQPRNVEEIATRNEEKLTQLGPVVERVQQEKLKVAIDRAYDILERAGRLPPPPEELDGVTIEVEFISVLAQAQRLIGLGGIERTFGFATSIAQAFPDVLDTLDADAAIAEYGDIVGVPAKILRAKDKIDEQRQARAQAAQQQQAAEMAATIAPAAKAGAETAQLLFDSPGTNGAPNLADRLLGTS